MENCQSNDDTQGLDVNLIFIYTNYEFKSEKIEFENLSRVGNTFSIPSNFSSDTRNRVNGKCTIMMI